MKNLYNGLFSRGKVLVTQVTDRPQSLLFLVAAILAALWLGPAAAILMLPLILLIFVPSSAQNRRPDRTPVTGKIRQRDMQTEIDRTLIATRRSTTALACMVIAIRDPAAIPDPMRHASRDRLCAISLDRLASVLRPQDQLFDLMNGQIGLVLSPLTRPGVEPILRLVERLRTTLEAPVQMASESIRPSVTIGVCLDSDAPNRSGRALCDAAMAALLQAERNGNGGLHIYSSRPQPQLITAQHATDTAHGLEDGAPRSYHIRNEPKAPLA